MKKMIALVAVMLVLAGCSSGEPKQELRVYNWGEYIDQTLISEFENEYNAKVIYEMFDSNEAMYVKVQSGSQFDVIIPSDYMIQRMRDEDMLQEVDYTKIPNYESVIDSLKGRHMDPENNYTVPYFWGNVGILYNKTVISESTVAKEGWDIFLNTEYDGRVYFYDSERDAFMVALKALGYSMNTTEPAELEAAYEWLLEMRRTMDPVYVTDDVIDGMMTGIKDLAVVYSGDANAIIAENPDMAYYAPEQGTNVWVDAMVIPVDAPNPDLAHKWMDFVLREDSSLRITEEVGYTSPLQFVIDDVSSAGGVYEGIESYVPRTGNAKDEEFFYDDQMKVILADYWQKVKASKP